ncbi:MAG: C4-dicarboxylate ABC transporter [Kangiella sp.]|nr:MAG: C4-dicarboxylate ABC transporter [Kangiella sp.]
MEWLALLMFICVCLVLLTGYPVAFSLAGTGILFAMIGVQMELIHPAILKNAGSRLFGIIQNPTLIAVPLFIFMGGILEKAKIADNLLNGIARLMGEKPSGLGVSVILVGALLAASTGIVGATVVTMGLISLPVMLKKGYSPSLASGIICASGTLGQIIPPSIVLVLLGDVIASANRDVGMGNDPISVGDLFAGALIPGFILVGMYILYLLFLSKFSPAQFGANLPVEDSHPINSREEKSIVDSQQDNKNTADKTHFSSQSKLQALKVIIAPLALIFLVLGSIMSGVATPTEAAAVGASGALLLAILNRQLNLKNLTSVMRSTTRTSSMIFMILIGASIFSLVFRAFNGDDAIENILANLPGGLPTAMLVVMLTMFVLGFILDFIEIVFVVVPLTAPALIALGADPIWLGVMIAVNLQTSFLTPPFGFALFYLRGVAPKTVKTENIYKGVMPFIGIQVLLLILLAIYPQITTWLPSIIYS